jgi:hypothetical protein
LYWDGRPGREIRQGNGDRFPGRRRNLRLRGPQKQRRLGSFGLRFRRTGRRDNGRRDFPDWGNNRYGKIGNRRLRGRKRIKGRRVRKGRDAPLRRFCRRDRRFGKIGGRFLRFEFLRFCFNGDRRCGHFRGNLRYGLAGSGITVRCLPGGAA